MLLAQTSIYFFGSWWSHKTDESPFRCCHRVCGNLLFNWHSFFLLWFQFFACLLFNAFGLSLCRTKKERCRTSYRIILTAYITILSTMWSRSMNRWTKKNCFPNLNWLLTELKDCCWICIYSGAHVHVQPCPHAYRIHSKRPTQMKYISHYSAKYASHTVLTHSLSQTHAAMLMLMRLVFMQRATFVSRSKKAGYY